MTRTRMSLTATTAALLAITILPAHADETLNAAFSCVKNLRYPGMGEGCHLMYSFKTAEDCERYIKEHENGMEKNFPGVRKLSDEQHGVITTMVCLQKTVPSWEPTR